MVALGGGWVCQQEHAQLMSWCLAEQNNQEWLYHPSGRSVVPEQPEKLRTVFTGKDSCFADTGVSLGEEMAIPVLSTSHHMGAPG